MQCHNIKECLKFSDCGEFDDGVMKIWGLFEMSCMQACKVAAALEDFGLAAQYPKAELRRCHNPVKQYFANLRLGGSPK